MPRLASRNPLSWLGGHSYLVLFACLVVVGGSWAFIEITDQVEDGASKRFDQWTLRVLRQKDNPAKLIGPSWTEEAARDTTALGGVTVLVLLIGAVAGYLFIERRYGPLVLLLVATLGGLIFNSILKHLYRRERPQVVPHLSDTFTTSYPSGHSMLSAIVYLTLGTMLARLVSRRVLKLYFVVLALLLTFLVGASRIIMGVHWPTDVLAGWSAGLVWALSVWLVARYLQRRRVIEPAAGAEQE